MNEDFQFSQTLSSIVFEFFTPSMYFILTLSFFLTAIKSEKKNYPSE